MLKLLSPTFIRLLPALLFGLMAGCANNQGGEVELVEVPDYSKEAYKIGVGDDIKVDVWNNDKLSVQLPVRPDGKISMPLVGDVLAAGYTTEQLAASVAEKLKKYIKIPQVAVIVTNPSSTDFQQRLRVTGAVRSPQSVAFRKGMTVLDLVLLAGGPNEFAVANKSKLYRRADGEVKVYPVYLNDILEKGKLDTNYPLAPSDIVTVPERAF